MALKNVLYPNTYSIVSSVYIDRSHKSVQMKLDIFSDESKTDLVVSKDIFLSCLSNYRKVDSVSRKHPDGTEKDGTYVFAPIDSTDAWAPFAGNFIQYMKTGNGVELFKIESSEGDMIQTPDGTIYRVKGDKTLLKQIAGTIEIWNKFFDFAISTADGTNLIKQCYEFLKTTSLCDGAVEV